MRPHDYRPKHNYDYERVVTLMQVVKHLAAGDFPGYMPIYQEADRELKAMIERENQRIATNDGSIQPDQPGKIVTPVSGPANSAVQMTGDPDSLVQRPTPPDPALADRVGGLTAEEKAAQDQAEAYRRGATPEPVPERTTHTYEANPNGTLNEPTRAADVDVERKV